MVSLQLDMYIWNFIQRLKMSKTYLFTSSKSKRQNKDGGPLSQNGVVLAGFEELVLENYTSLD